MDQSWTRDVARKAAMEKVEQAGVLLREAKEIFHSNDFDALSLIMGEALEYIDEAEE